MKGTQFCAAFLLCSTLVGCKSNTTDTPVPEDVIASIRGGINGIASAYIIASAPAQSSTTIQRPSAALGVYVSSFLAQGAFVHVTSALAGIEAQMQLLAGQNVPTTSETFALLTELATIMQVDIPDMLNRSTNRAEALNAYLESLRATGQVAQRKYKELEVQKEELQDKRGEQRTEASSIERESSTAFRNGDYTTAAGLQEKLTVAQSNLAQTDTELDQTNDLIRRYEDMLEIAAERVQAIEQNRQILIAGLRVKKVPGIENLDILDASRTYRKSRSKAGEDVFGTEYIQ